MNKTTETSCETILLPLRKSEAKNKMSVAFRLEWKSSKTNVDKPLSSLFPSPRRCLCTFPFSYSTSDQRQVETTPSVSYSSWHMMNNFDPFPWLGYLWNKLFVSCRTSADGQFKNIVIVRRQTSTHFSVFKTRCCLNWLQLFMFLA